MEQLKCPNCGGNINRSRMICEYCGTQFKEDKDNILHFVRCEHRIDVLGSRISIPASFFHNYEFNSKEAAEYVTNYFASEFAKSMRPYLDMNTSFDMDELAYVVNAQVRVVRPGVEF